MTGPALPPIGERLRQARTERGMTVRGLARMVDLSASLISQIETGRSSPSVSTLYAITAALDISIEDVFSAGSPRRSATGEAPNGTATACQRQALSAARPPRRQRRRGAWRRHLRRRRHLRQRHRFRLSQRRGCRDSRSGSGFRLGRCLDARKRYGSNGFGHSRWRGSIRKYCRRRSARQRGGGSGRLKCGRGCGGVGRC